MHHFFEAITNTKGDSLVGYFARVIDPVTLAVVPIYADNSATGIDTISGVANMAKTDGNGNLSLYVAPGTYHLDIYSTDSTTFVIRVSNVAMAGDITEGAAAALAAAQAAAASALASKLAADADAAAALVSQSAAAASEAAASASATASAINGKVYADTTTGLANTSGTGSTNRYFSVPDTTVDYMRLYRNDAGSATLVNTYPSQSALTAAVAALSAATVATYAQEMKGAAGSGTLRALFDMDGVRTAYSGSPTILTALTSLDANAYSLGLYGTIYSGTNPRPVYTAGRGIYFSSGAGLQTTSQMLTKTSGDFAFLYAVDLNTLTGTVGTEAALSGTDGDLYLVNADRNVVTGLGADVPIVLNTDGFAAAQLGNGYFKRNDYAATWDRETYLFAATGTGGQVFSARINHKGQLVVFIYDGTNAATIKSDGNILIGQSVLTFAVQARGNTFYLYINGQLVNGNTPTTKPNVNALNQWYFNGGGRQGAVAQPVQVGLRHYFKGMAIVDDLPDEAAFTRAHDAFAARHGGIARKLPRAARGVIVMGQSWTAASVAVTDTWRHGPNSWDGQVTPNNLSYAQETNSITRDAFPNVFACQSPDIPSDIAPWAISVDASGNQSVSHAGGSGENLIGGWAKQVLAHASGRLCDWYLAIMGVGGASIATLSFQSVVPLPTQLKSITLASNDYYNKVLRQIVYQRDLAQAKGQVYTVDLILWQQGHTDAGNASYAATLIALYDRICTDVSAITGQAHKPVLLAPQINYSTDGTVNSCTTIDQQFLEMEDTRGTRPMFCIGPMYPYTSFIHPPRTGHRWAGEIFGLATTRILFDGESYGCCRPYAYTYSVGGTTIDIDYRVRTGRSLVTNATNANNVYATVSNAGFEFTDASAGGVAISSVAATSATRIRVTLSGAIGAGDTIRYTGTTHRVGNVADGAAVNGLYQDQDWTVPFTSNEPKFTLGGYNDVRQFAAVSSKVL